MKPIYFTGITIPRWHGMPRNAKLPWVNQQPSQPFDVYMPTIQFGAAGDQLIQTTGGVTLSDDEKTIIRAPETVRLSKVNVWDELTSTGEDVRAKDCESLPNVKAQNSVFLQRCGEVQSIKANDIVRLQWTKVTGDVGSKQHDERGDHHLLLRTEVSGSKVGGEVRAQHVQANDAELYDVHGHDRVMIEKSVVHGQVTAHSGPIELRECSKVQSILGQESVTVANSTVIGEAAANGKLDVCGDSHIMGDASGNGESQFRGATVDGTIWISGKQCEIADSIVQGITMVNTDNDSTQTRSPSFVTVSETSVVHGNIKFHNYPGTVYMENNCTFNGQVENGTLVRVDDINTLP